MTQKRRHYSAQFKFRVALEAMKEQQTISALASQYEVHPTLVRNWKKQLVTGGAALFQPRSKKKSDPAQIPDTELYEQIGRLKMELEWLKKKKNLNRSVKAKRMMIEPKHPVLSIRRQCKLIGLNRATLYAKPQGETALNLDLMRLIDEQYLRTPFYGYPKMTAVLRRRGYAVNAKRVARLMQKMGLQALVPRRNLSQSAPGHNIYPYLLRNLAITHSNQVWSTDITYIPMARGFMYLVAVIDWYSRYVLAWQLSNTLDGSFCLDTLNEALVQCQPEIFNTDQGSQFTALAFTGRLAAAHIHISMDGRGRALDNIFVERLWRTVKYEDIYLKDYATGRDLHGGLNAYFNFYNNERLHQSLAYQTPYEVYHAQQFYPAVLRA